MPERMPFTLRDGDREKLEKVRQERGLSTLTKVFHALLDEACGVEASQPPARGQPDRTTAKEIIASVPLKDGRLTSAADLAAKQKKDADFARRMFPAKGKKS